MKVKVSYHYENEASLIDTVSPTEPLLVKANDIKETESGFSIESFSVWDGKTERRGLKRIVVEVVE